jgi:O-antigen ligase
MTRDERVDWWAGFLLGFPFAYPAPPLYVVAFAIFFILVVLRGSDRALVPAGQLLGVLVLVAVALASSVIGSTRTDLDIARIVTTSFFFVLLLFGNYVRSRRSLLDGFAHATALLAVAVLLAAVVLRVDRYGIFLFTVPNRRLWGADYFPDWPNFLAFLLSVGGLLDVLVFRRFGRAALIFSAALLTTSRTPIIALLILGVFICWRFLPTPAARLAALVGAVAVVVAVLIPVLATVEANLVQRLFIIGDRQEIWRFAGRLIADSPVIGHGAVLLDASVGFAGQPSFHNSYLDVAVRHGLLGLVIFLWLLYPTRRQWQAGGFPMYVLFAFFILGSWFQNFLKHPHLLMVFSGLLGPWMVSDAGLEK